MVSSLPQHPFGLRYYLLWLGALAIRLPAKIVLWFVVNKSFRNLRPDVSRTRIQIPSREKGRKITVDVYEKADRSKSTKQFVHLNFHGSGYTIPSLGTDVDWCARLASTGTTVFDSDYRKAPEHPFPAAFEDAQDVLSYVKGHSSDFDVKRITAGGFSAGGNLAMALAVNAAPGSIAGVASFYGNADMTKVYAAPDVKNFDGGGVLPDWMRTFFYSCLILPGQDRSDPRLSPAYAPLDRWPKHIFLTCGTADSLHESGRIMVDTLKDAGHEDATFLSVERSAHSFDKNVKQGSQTEERRDKAYRLASQMIDRVHKD